MRGTDPVSTISRLSVAAASLLLLAACSSGGSASSATAPADADVTITAQGNAFDTATLELSAEPTSVFFKNLDGQPHNVAIYADESATQKVFVGEVITDAATTYQVPALDAGHYFFRCDVHPDMNGSVTVVAA
jgi:plastocyanin